MGAVAGQSAFDGQAELFRLINRDLGDLSENEKAVLAFVEIAATCDRELDSNEEIAHRLGCSGTGTVRGIMLRLERKGYIKIESFQRGRRVYVERLEKWTASPHCTAPHWREVYDQSTKSTPTLPLHVVRTVPTVMSEINRLMQKHSLTFANAQIMLMSHGVSRLAEQAG